MTFTKVTNTGIGSTGTVLLQNLDVIGIVTAGFGVSTVDVFTTGVSTFSGITNITNTTDSTSSTTGALIVTGGVGIAASLNVGGSVSVGGTLTYEDVTNVDSVGIITARGGVFISAGSSIGIGSATPTADIEVHSSNNTLGILSSTNSGANLSIFDTNSESKIRTVGGRIHISADDGDLVDDSEIRFLVDSNVVARISAGSTLSLGANTDNQLSTPATDTLALRTAGSERIRIASDGKIGIGTAGPTSRLHLAAGGGECIIEMQRNVTNTTGNVGAINFTASDGHSLASIGAYGDGDNEGAYINFKTTSAASANSPFTSTTERMRITSAGYVEGNINVPCWFGRQDTAHNVSNGAWTTIINLGNSVINPSMNNGGWSESTGIFTVQSGQAGLYYVYGQTAIDDVQDNDVVRAGFSKNDGTVPLYSQQRCIDQGANTILNSGLIAQTVSLAVGDTIKLQVYHNEGSTEPTEPVFCFFGGYRLSS